MAASCILVLFSLATVFELQRGHSHLGKLLSRNGTDGHSRVSGNGKRKVVLLTDFRLFPVLIALDLVLRNSNIFVLVSEAHLLFGDYGGRQVTQRRKKAILWVLRLFCEVQLVQERSGLHEDHSECYGCLTSMVSETRDASADRFTDPSRFAEINRLCSGAGELLREIKSQEVEIVFVFNGRLASTRKVADELKTIPTVELRVYEWFTVSARSSITGYRLASYSIHSHSEAEQGMVAALQLENPGGEVEDVAGFVNSKLGSTHAAAAHAEPEDKQYSSVLFPGTPHEYKWATKGEDEIDGLPEKLVERALVHPDFREPFLIRMHPNTAGTKDEFRLVEQLQKLIEGRDGEIVPPSSPVSSHELIKRCPKVFVGGSSIALDSYLLGKVPIFLGANTYRELIHRLEETAPGNHANGLRAASIAKGFFLNQKRDFSPVLLPLVMLHAVNWRVKRLRRSWSKI